MRNKIEDIIIEYQKAQEKQSGKPIEIPAGVDETFFNNMILVLMDLSSGYIFVEEESQDRTYETWKEKVQRVIDKLGIKIKYVVSDRAKALIKLALQGLNCLSIPDLFHASNDIVRLFGSRFHKRLASVKKKLAEATAALIVIK